MIAIVLLTVIFFLINGIPYTAIWFGRWPRQHGLPLLILGFAITFFGLSPTARAVNQTPDGGYPGRNTAEGDDALFGPATVSDDGVGNTARGWQALSPNTTDNNDTAISLFILGGNVDGGENVAAGIQASILIPPVAATLLNPNHKTKVTAPSRHRLNRKTKRKDQPNENNNPKIP